MNLQDIVDKWRALMRDRQQTKIEFCNICRTDKIVMQRVEVWQWKYANIDDMTQYGCYREKGFVCNKCTRLVVMTTAVVFECKDRQGKYIWDFYFQAR